jgi:hypothetical protein
MENATCCVDLKFENNSCGGWCEPQLCSRNIKLQGTFSRRISENIHFFATMVVESDGVMMFSQRTLVFSIDDTSAPDTS